MTGPVTDEPVKSVMLYIGGSQTAFRCHCGANVFHLVPDTLKPEQAARELKIYECNGCREWYTEAVDPDAPAPQ